MYSISSYTRSNSSRLLSRLSLFVLLFTAFTLISCNNDDETKPQPPDTTKPVINVQTPANGFTKAVGESFVLNLILTDDRDLGELKIDIHSAADGHGHGKTSAAYTFVQIIALEGQTQTVNLNITIPADAPAGPYDLVLTATDRAANAATFVEIDWNLTSPSQPVISNVKVNGMTGEHPEVNFGQKDTTEIRLQAKIEDPDGLEHIHLKLVEAGSHKRAEDDDKPIWEWEKEMGGATTYTLDETIQALKTWLEGKAEADLELKIEVKDVKDNITIQEVEMHLKP